MLQLLHILLLIQSIDVIGYTKSHSKKKPDRIFSITSRSDIPWSICNTVSLTSFILPICIYCTFEYDTGDLRYHFSTLYPRVCVCVSIRFNKQGVVFH